MFLVGTAGWIIFNCFHVPMSPLFGSLAAVGCLRVAQIPLPQCPLFITILVQNIFGIYLGTKFNKQAIWDLVYSFIPSAIIVFWAVGSSILIGYLFFSISNFDLSTSILSSSIGGLPEMSLIAVATGANTPVIVVMQTVRMVLTVVIFPIIIKKRNKTQNEEINNCRVINSKINQKLQTNPGGLIEMLKTFGKQISVSSIKNFILTVGIAAVGSCLFFFLKIPGGVLVGSTLFIALSQIAGLHLATPSPKLMEVTFLGIGIGIANNVSMDTIKILASRDFAIICILFTLFVFISSFMVAYVISRVTKWDFTTCLLASAPGGLTVMIALAVKYDINPIQVSILHLCRLTALQLFLPLFFVVFT